MVSLLILTNIRKIRAIWVKTFVSETYEPDLITRTRNVDFEHVHAGVIEAAMIFFKNMISFNC